MPSLDLFKANKAFFPRGFRNSRIVGFPACWSTPVFVSRLYFDFVRYRSLSLKPLVFIFATQNGTIIKAVVRVMGIAQNFFVGSNIIYIIELAIGTEI